MQHLHFVYLAARARIVLFVVVAAACGDYPTSPSRYPQVAGRYFGNFTISARSLGVISQSGVDVMEVTQSGSLVAIGGASVLADEVVEIPSITGTINEAGVFTPPAGAALAHEPRCGTWMLASATISFSGRSMRIEETMGTDHCGVITFSGTFSRQG